ncbi:M18 family aminopeptidase [Pectinatus haikarae]|uniref:M18 family aminopeptidase n=1 Tax=Pectinatus haikarae TaxID=349096 RepID=UPI0018C4B591|nr:M18 family aminopeptidase [Pectinatus haikarae]
MTIPETTDALLKFIAESASPFHAVAAAAARLDNMGFTELSPTNTWHLKKGGKYYLRIYSSALVAFCINEHPLHSIRAAVAHTDFPCLRIKPQASISKNGYNKLNIEIYGGMILNTWLDRPLSIAGKIVRKGETPFKPHIDLLDFKRPMLTIPNLAIHMNRKINEGNSLNPQKDMLPLAGMTSCDKLSDDFFLEMLAKKMDCPKKEILSYELTVYPAESGCVCGFDNEFISSPRLDNLTSVRACIKALTESNRPDGINIAALFDNEEVGSRTKQGAGSLLMPQVIERIYKNLGFSTENYFADIAGGFLLSADVAHALHPNNPEKNDPTNLPLLNKGPVIKIAANQSYAGDAEAVGIIKELCCQHDIPYQMFVNRSDMRGGSTLGSILSANMPMRTLDIGIPILAMHSAREIMGINDQPAIEKLIQTFFSA